MIRERAVLQMRAVDTPQEWKAYHAIRRTVLWEARGRFGVYDEHHPDELLPSNHPLLLFADAIPVAVVRIDLVSEITAAFRRVAVGQNFQRKGYGQELVSQAEAFAMGHGRKQFIADVAIDAGGFWERIGYVRSEHISATGNPRMEKWFS